MVFASRIEKFRHHALCRRAYLHVHYSPTQKTERTLKNLRQNSRDIVRVTVFLRERSRARKIWWNLDETRGCRSGGQASLRRREKNRMIRVWTKCKGRLCTKCQSGAFFSKYLCDIFHLNILDKRFPGVFRTSVARDVPQIQVDSRITKRNPTGVHIDLYASFIH